MEALAAKQVGYQIDEGRDVEERQQRHQAERQHPDVLPAHVEIEKPRRRQIQVGHANHDDDARPLAITARRMLDGVGGSSPPERRKAQADGVVGPSRPPPQHHDRR
jgi:hypothetical protein